MAVGLFIAHRPGGRTDLGNEHVIGSQTRGPGHVGAARGIHRHAPRDVLAVSAQVAAVGDRRSAGDDLGDEPVRVAVEVQIREGQRREGGLRRLGLAGHVRVALGVHSYAITEVVAVPPDVAAVRRGPCRRVHLGHEGVVVLAVEGQVRTDRYREGGLVGLGAAGDVGVTGRVHGDAGACVGCRSPRCSRSKRAPCRPRSPWPRRRQARRCR